jgi:hypothetical protein
MVYPKQMATGTSGKQESVNPKLRRKMLERWENEGGRVGEIDALETSTGSQTTSAQNRRTKVQTPNKPGK